MSITVLINGVDRTSDILQKSLQVTWNVAATATCRFSSRAYKPSIGHRVQVQLNGTTIWDGQVADVVTTYQRHVVRYDVTASDAYFLDRRIANDGYVAQTLQAIINDLLTVHLNSEGYTSDFLAPGPTIARFVADYVTVSEAFRQLADLTGWDWTIRPGRVIEWRESPYLSSSLTLTDDDLLELSRKEGLRNYRNKQYIRGGKSRTSTQTEQFAGDGKTRSFNVAYAVAEAPTVQVNGVAKTVGIRGVDTGKDWYWSKNTTEISQDSSATPLSGTDTLTVSYVGFYPLVSSVTLDYEVTNRQAVEGGSGLHESVIVERAVEDEDTALTLISSLVNRYGVMEDQLLIRTLTRLEAGKVVTINSTALGISGDYYVQQVTMRSLHEDASKSIVVYDAKVVNRAAREHWSRVIARMLSQRQSIIGSERTADVVNQLVQFSDSVPTSDSILATSSAPESRVGFAQVGYSEVA